MCGGGGGGGGRETKLPLLQFFVIFAFYGKEAEHFINYFFSHFLVMETLPVCENIVSLKISKDREASRDYIH